MSRSSDEHFYDAELHRLRGEPWTASSGSRPTVRERWPARRDGLSRVQESSKHQSGRGNLAAAPGQSNHGWGLSVDINVPDQRTYLWLTKHAAEYGFVNDVPSEKWHWTYQR